MIHGDRVSLPEASGTIASLILEEFCVTGGCREIKAGKHLADKI